jgi:hypothetical protein
MGLVGMRRDVSSFDFVWSLLNMLIDLISWCGYLSSYIDRMCNRVENVQLCARGTRRCWKDQFVERVEFHLAAFFACTNTNALCQETGLPPALRDVSPELGTGRKSVLIVDFTFSV